MHSRGACPPQRAPRPGELQRCLCCVLCPLPSGAAGGSGQPLQTMPRPSARGSRCPSPTVRVPNPSPKSESHVRASKESESGFPKPVVRATRPRSAFRTRLCSSDPAGRPGRPKLRAVGLAPGTVRSAGRERGACAPARSRLGSRCGGWRSGSASGSAVILGTRAKPLPERAERRPARPNHAMPQRWHAGPESPLEARKSESESPSQNGCHWLVRSLSPAVRVPSQDQMFGPKVRVGNPSQALRM